MGESPGKPDRFSFSGFSSRRTYRNLALIDEMLRSLRHGVIGVIEEFKTIQSISISFSDHFSVASFPDVFF